jgi:hypothetical protein
MVIASNMSAKWFRSGPKLYSISFSSHTSRRALWYESKSWLAENNIKYHDYQFENPQIDFYDDECGHIAFILRYM